MTEDPDRLKRIRGRATELREAIITSGGVGLISLAQFPAGSCGDASILLGQYLSDHGLGDWEYISGIRNSDRHSHAWIEKDGVLVDITSDQFDDVTDEVVVTEDPSWHSQFVEDSPRHAARVDAYDPLTCARLSNAYKQIASAIEEEHT